MPGWSIMLTLSLGVVAKLRNVAELAVAEQVMLFRQMPPRNAFSPPPTQFSALGRCALLPLAILWSERHRLGRMLGF